MIIKNLIFLSIVLLNTACTNKNLYILSKDSLYEKGFEYTNVKDIVYKDETKAIINITYLNPSDPKNYDYKYHEFLIGIYNVSNDNKENLGLEDKNFILSLNSNTKYIKTLLKEDSYLYDRTPIKNPYAKYYLIKFNKSKEKLLNIKYSHKKYGSASIIYKRY